MPRSAALARLLAAPAGTDAELLGRFAQARDEAAFAELVRRHGGLVRGAARRLTGDAHAADDVAQAAFLLLARRAGDGGWGRTVGPWLYRVACRMARKARGRRPFPVPLRPDAPAPPADPAAPVVWAEARAALDEELARLPGTLRDPLVLCYIQGLSRDEAAAAAGCPTAVLKGRLERGRAKLKARLERRGLTLAVGLAGAVADPGPVASAAAVAKLAATASADGELPAGVAALLCGSAAGWKAATAAAVVFAAVAAGAAAMSAAAHPPVPMAEPARAEVKTEPSPAAASDGAAPVRVDAHGDPLPDGAVARLGTVRFRPGADVLGLAFSPDGRRVASWGDAMYKHDQFSLWDAADGRELRSVRTLERTLVTLAWAADGRGFAVLKASEQGGDDRNHTTDLRVWEFTADPPGQLPRPSGRTRTWFRVNGASPPLSFEAAAVSPDGGRLAVAPDTGGKPGPVRVYPMKAMDSLADEPPAATLAAPPVACTALAFTPDGRFLVGAGPAADAKTTGAAAVVVWDAASGRIARSISAPAGAVQSRKVHIAASDERVAVGLATGDAFVADLRTGAGRTVPTGHKVAGWPDGVTAVAFGPGGRLLATGGDNSPVRVWDAATGTAVRDLRPAGQSNAIAFSADGSRLAAGGHDTVLRVWDLSNGTQFGPAGVGTGGVWGAALSPDGLTAVTSSGGPTIRVWDARAGTERRAIPAGGAVTPSGREAAVGLTPDGRTVVALVDRKEGGGRVLRAWDAATGADATPPGFPVPMPGNGFRFTRDGAVLVTRDVDRLAAWDWPAGAKRWDAGLPTPTDALDHLDVSADGRFLAVCGHRSRGGRGDGDGFAATLDLFDAKTGRHVHRLSRTVPILKPARFAPDGTLLHVFQGGFVARVGVGDRAAETKAEVCVVDPLSGRVVREFPLDPGPIPGMDRHYTNALSADGKVLFRTTNGGGLEAVEVATGRLRTAWAGHRETAVTIATSADEVRRVMTGSVDTTALVWDVGIDGGPPAALSAGRKAGLWAALGDKDAEAGYRTLTELASDPGGFVALAGDRLTPTPAAPPAVVLTPVFEDLDGPSFPTRRAASANLEGFGEAVVPAVRDRLAAGPSAEARERLMAVLDRHAPGAVRGDDLRRVRAVELLEHLGTSDARRVLGRLAAGGPSRQTTDAAAAARRLSRRP